MKFNINDNVTYVDPSLTSSGAPSPEDVLIGEDFFSKKYRRPDGSTYTHVPLNDWTPTAKVYTAKDSEGNTLRSATGKLVTGNTQQEANNKLFWDNYNNAPLITPKDPIAATKEAASYIPFVGEGIDLYNIGKDIHSGNYGQAALGTGLFLLPEFGEKLVKRGISTLGRYMPSSSDYNRFVRDFKTFFRTPINENPIKNVQRSRLYRYRWSSPTINPGTYNYTGPANSQENALDLLIARSNYNKNNVISKLGTQDLNTIDLVIPNIKYYTDHIPFSEAKNIAKKMTGEDNFLVNLGAYGFLNMRPASAIQDAQIGVMNTGALSKLGLYNRPDVTKAHEYHHMLNLSKIKAPPRIFSTSHLPKRAGRYLNASEIAARGSQLKNYFGFKRDEKLTGDMLKYAAEHYSKDVFDNNMQQLFSTIKDWDAAAEWFNKNSFKHGGRLNFS